MPELYRSCTQERIAFVPTSEEIAEAALLHIGRVNRAVVSFGQCCEGEPLTAADAIEGAIRLIRSATRRGTINLNTNAGRPKQVARLCAAGLDSIRVSVNSLRPECYRAYFRPKGYGFNDVLRSIDAALERGRFVSINYLNTPGFTDTAAEAEALMAFLEAYPIHMIQWRNLNFDPLRYWKAMGAVAPGASHAPDLDRNRASEMRAAPRRWHDSDQRRTPSIGFRHASRRTSCRG